MRRATVVIGGREGFYASRTTRAELAIETYAAETEKGSD